MASLASLLVSFLLFSASLTSPVPGNRARELSERQSSVPYGSIIYGCTVPNTVALTFDDGPYIYTEQVLDILKNNSVRGTFFLNGQNMANIYDYSSTVKRIAAEGHQVGSHTWSHPYLTQLSKSEMQQQMWQLETALRSILGYIPSYMRPPYFDTNDLVVRTMAELGYHVINCNIDTNDWANDTPDAIWNSVASFKQGLDAGGNLELSHDIHQNTVKTLVQQMINEVKSRGLKAVPVGECLGDAAANWYRS